MRRVALVGMDGTGKSTVARHLAGRDGIAVVHSIRPHEDPASPDAPLSRQLAAASAAADTTGRAPLKVAILYLQLCLYGAAERRTEAPILLADRHPLIDPLVYLPLYARMPPSAPAPDLPLPADVRDWLKECGGDSLDSLGRELLQLATLPLPDLLADLTRRFGVSLPDRVVLLDLPVGEALSRAQSRGGAEIHETAAVLTAVRARYGAVFDWLAGHAPGVEVRRVACSGLTPEETSEAVRGVVVVG